MSIIDRIKRLLGVADDDRGADADTGGAVTIERERSDADPATETEAAIKGTDAGAAVDDAGGTDSSGTESATTGVVDPDAETEAETTTEAEPADTDDETSDTEETSDTKATAEETDDEPATDETTEPDETTTSVEEVRGIGPAYADRLAAADVETVAELAAADPEQVAETTDLSPKRLRTWIDRASDDETA